MKDSKLLLFIANKIHINVKDYELFYFEEVRVKFQIIAEFTIGSTSIFLLPKADELTRYNLL